MSWHAGILDEGGIDWPRALLVGLALAVVLAVGIVATTSTAAFGPYNSAWEGSSDLREQVENDPDVDANLVRDPARYGEVDAEGTTAFVVAPDDAYSEAEASRIRDFVANGGRLVVFENVGEAGNTLLADVGADARLDGRVLRDDYHHSRGPSMPVATGVRNHTLTAGVDQLSLNYATAVEANTATVLVTSSTLATLGDDGDDPERRLDLTAHPVATVETVGEGQVVVVGDPSLTINAMVSEPDNADFLRGLYADSDRVLLDFSQVDDIPPLTAALLVLRDTPLLQLFLGSAGIATVGLHSTGHLRPVFERVRSRRSRARGYSGTDTEADTDTRTGTRAGGGKTKTKTEMKTEPTTDHTVVDAGLSRAERADFLRSQHPEWEEKRVQRVLTATARTEARTDVASDADTDAAAGTDADPSPDPDPHSNPTPDNRETEHHRRGT